MGRWPQRGIGVFTMGAACIAALIAGCSQRAQVSGEDPPAAPDGTRVFFDDFTDGEAQWEATVGEWDLRDTGTTAYGARARQYALTIAGNTMWRDYQLQARVTIHDDRAGQAGVAGRVQGPHYYYEFLLGRDDAGVKSWFIRQQRNHVWVTLASGPYDYVYDRPYLLRFSLEGSTFTGELSPDGGRSFVTLGTALATGASDWGLGRIGLVTYGASATFDDVSVGEVQVLQQAATTGPWGQLVTLRDNTGKFAGAPSGGWYVTPIHANLRASDGKVVITGFGRKAAAGCSSTTQRQVGETWILDPASLITPPAGNNLNVTSLTEANADQTHEVLYCAGHSTLPGGRIFYSAGTRYPDTLPDSSPEFGLNYGRIFDPATGVFTRITAPMKGSQTATPGMKWYPTNMAMPDGTVLMFGGFHWSSGGTGSNVNLSLELFDPKIWDANHGADPYTVLTNHAEGNSQTPPTRGYTNLLLLPKPVPAGSAGGLARSTAVAGGFGKVFLFNHEPGPTGSARLFARPNAQTINPSSTEKGEGSSGVVLPDGQLMFTNGGHDGAGSAAAYFYNPYTDSWSSLALGVSRIYSDAIWLPDGTVLVINGYTSEPGNIGDVANPVGDLRQPQLINPFTRTFTTEPAWPEPTGRGYHAVALLLKDGRVLVGGGKDNNHATGCEKNELRVWDPPYMTKGARPAITSPGNGSTMTIGGAAINVAFTGTVRATRGVALLRTGSLTHGFDQGQRYVPLSFTPGGAGTLVVTPPSDPNVAPPGDYLMFVVSDQDVPSVGVHVKVAAPPACVYAVDGNAHSYIEAEGRSRQAGPFAQAADESRSGGAFEVVAEGSGNHTTVPDEGKVLWYDLKVTNGGDFFLSLLANGPDSGSDSLWFSLDGGPDTAVTTTSGWGWVTSPAPVAISTGNHTLKLKVREDGVLIDKALLTRATAFTPTNLGNTALACNGAAGLVKPTGVAATPGDSQVQLAWNPVSGASSYTVKIGTTSGGPYDFFTQAGVTGTTFTTTGLTNGTTYYFVVSASNAAGESPDSSQVSATPGATPPAIISNLVVNDNLPAGCTAPNCNRDKWSVQSSFAIGAVAFGDRTYTVDAVPAAGSVLLGKPWIRTAADSKNYPTTPLATYLNNGTFLYLLVDNRHNATSGKPAFLDATWTDQGYDVTIRQTSTSTFAYSVWRKAITPGTTVGLPAIGTTTAPCYLAVVQ
jgi:hypothetical protein